MLAEITPIEETIKIAGRTAAFEHERAGLPLVVWKHGRIAYAPPDAINDAGAIRDDEPNDAAEPGALSPP